MTDQTGSPRTQAVTERWDRHDDSCACHIGICRDCGCTNEAPSVANRRELFEAGRATGRVEGWADHTDAHEDEYDALAREFHESIAEGQTEAETAKALRFLGGENP